MKRKVLFSLIVLLLSALCCGACFACGSSPEAPKVENVAITAAEGDYGIAGMPHRITYTAPEGSKVSYSVQLGGSPATVSDYSCRGDEFFFYTAGNYTVTVYVAKDGMLGSASANITVRAERAFVADVSLRAADGETYGKVGAIHVLSYTVPAGSEVSVTVEKDGAAASDASYDSSRRTLVFASAGTYTVKVQAALGGSSETGSANITVAAADPPAVALSLSEATVTEEETVVLTPSVTCSYGDSVIEETVSVRYRAGSGGSYAAASTADYALEDNLFTPLAAGRWQLIYSVRTAGGAQSASSAELVCEPAEVTLTAKESGRIRIETNAAAEIDYLAEGAAGRYNVTFDTHGNSNVTAVAGAGRSVKVTAQTEDWFTVTVVYTHKTQTSVKKTLDLEFYSVSSLRYSPVFGEDPFGGMPGDVLTSMGHLLYLDAATAGGVPISVRDAEFKVTENNVSSEVQILYGAADNADYPYVIVTNFDNNTATGKFTLQMKVTDPYTGNSAVAKRQFNVLATTNNNSTAVTNICNYVKSHADFYSLGGMDLSMLCSDTRQNMVLTKTGVIMQRTNPDWVLHGADNSENADFAGMALSSASENCRLEFDFTLLAQNYVSGAVRLGIGLRTQNANGWAGFFDLKAGNGRLVFTYEKSDSAVLSQTFGDPLPAVSENTYLGVRIDRRTSGGLATYSVFVRTERGGEYREYLRCAFHASSAAGDAGAAVAKYQFTHRSGGGCYAVENVRFETL